MGYDFKIEYKLEKENMVANSLSRLQHNKELMVITASQLNMPSLIQEIKANKELQTINQAILVDHGHRLSYTIEYERLLYKNRIYYPRLLYSFHVL